jgi:integrase
MTSVQDRIATPATIEQHPQVLRAALGDAIRWGLHARNAAALAYGPRVQRTQLNVLSADQAKVFLEEINGDRLEALFNVAVAAGLRLGELLGLRWSDVDLDAGAVTVRQAFAANRERTAVR